MLPGTTAAPEDDLLIQNAIIPIDLNGLDDILCDHALQDFPYLGFNGSLLQPSGDIFL